MQVITGDLINLNEEQRKEHYLNVCVALKINAATRPLAYFEQIGFGGKRTLILYTLRGGAQQIAAANGISTSVARDRDSEVDGVVAFKAIAANGKRAVEAVGASVISKANNPADAIMTAQTKACRRAILDMTGSGLLDETEVDGMSGNTIECDPGLGNSTYVPTTPAPEPSSETAEEVFDKGGPPNVKSANLLPDYSAVVQPPSLAEVAAPQIVMIPESFKQDMDKITARLNLYRRDTLQQGGMRPSKGFGIAAKWAKFIAKNAPNKTVEEYEALLTAMDLMLQQLGPAAVVEKIEKDIA